MGIKLEIKKRNKDYGIVTWPYSMDFDIKTLFNQKDTIDVNLDGKVLKNRKVSYKYRRFSIGKKRIEKLGKKKFFCLKKEKGQIKISAL